MPAQRNPNDAVVGNVKRLRADVRALQKKVDNLERYYDKALERLEHLIAQGAAK